MTEREEQAVVVLNTLHDNPLLSDIHRQALEVGMMAIDALSRSENPNKWIAADVLDKIKAEIEQFAENPNFGDLSLGVSCGAMKAIEIINKYKAESEVSDADSN